MKNVQKIYLSTEAQILWYNKHKDNLNNEVKNNENCNQICLPIRRPKN